MGALLAQSAAWQSRLAAVRDEAIDVSVALLAALSVPTAALVVLRETVIGWRPGMAVAIGLAVTLCGTYVARRRIPAAVKAGAALGVLCAAALDGFLSLGLASYGAMYLVTSVVLATLLLGPRWGVRALGAAVALACVLTIAVAAHRLTFSADLDAYNAAPAPWLALPVTLALLAGTLLAAGGKVYAALIEELRVSEERAEALRRSEERFRMLVEAAPVGICVLTAHGRFVEVNDAYCALTGRAREELIGREVADLYPPEEREAYLVHLRARFAAGLTELVEFALLTKRGERRTVLGRGTTAVGPGGQPQRLGFAVDITERKRAEEAQAHLAAIVASTSDAVIGRTLDGTITSWNAGAERLYGYTAAEAIGRPVAILTVPGGQEETAPLAFLAAMGRGESIVELDAARRRKDGAAVPVSISASLVRDRSGAIAGAVGIHRDISARKAAEEALARANAELAHANADLETILRVLPVGIGIADDPAVRRIRMNPALARMLGLPPEANASLSAPEGERPTTYRVYRGGRELAAEELAMQVAASTSREVRDMEVEVVRDDGARLTQLAYAAPLHDEQGRVRGAVGVCLDITALRELERAREDFLLAAAHDLRTPLTAIRGQVQIVHIELERLDAPELAPLVAMLGRALVRADEMLALIREMGGVARQRLGGALDLQPQPTDLVALVRAAAESQRVVSGRTIQVQAGPGELRAEVDPARVARVVGNLLGNAVKYSPPETAIWVRLGRGEGPGGPEAVLEVRDEGVGVPAADLPHIFERFRRGGNVAGLAEGAGIGLASARAVVEQHGGSIGAESEEGAGATFTVRLPLATRERAGAEEGKGGAPPGKGGQRRSGPAR